MIQDQQVVSSSSSDDSSTSNDHFQILVGPITRAQAKILKKTLIGLMQEDVANQMTIGSTILDKHAINVTNFIWARNGDVDHNLGLKTSKQRAWILYYTWEDSFGPK